MDDRPLLTILGAGAAGLAVGYYARKNGISFRIYEASENIGGNSSTVQYKDYLFDTGAHRFHNRFPDITREIIGLLKDDIKRIDIPSKIYSEGKFIDFPISPLNLFMSIGIQDFFRSCVDVGLARLRKKTDFNSFEAYALNTYGDTVARRFLLNYSKKLWGKDCRQLSVDVAGKRLNGLNLKTFLLEALSGDRSKTEHLDGSFYYPQKGIGMIADRLSSYCGDQNIVTNSQVTGIHHDGRRINQIVLRQRDQIPVQNMVSSLPLSAFISMMEPQPPQELLRLADTMKFRDIILVALFVRRPSMTKYGSIYFPDADIPFTRIYEPKNRSPHMAPADQTSIIVEIPCQQNDEIWNYTDNQLAALIREQVCRITSLTPGEIEDQFVYRMRNAYPVLELGFDEKLRQISDYFDQFENLKFTGRNGRFVYSHIHDMMKFGKDIVNEFYLKHHRLRN